MIQPKIQEVWFPPIDDDLDLKYLMYHTYEPRILHLERKIVFSEEEFEQFKRELGSALLEKAAKNVKLIEKYTETYDSNFSNESKSLFSVNYTDGDGETYGATEIDIDKESITSVLDDFLLNNKI